VQRFPVDEDCVLLLCSDGLSDKDRVEECWEAEILPILDGSISVARARDRLIEIANTRNGHDNVTVALIHCHAHLKDEGNTFTELSVAPLDTPPEPIIDGDDVPTDLTWPTTPGNGNSEGKTQLVQPDKSKSSFSLLLKIVFLLGLGGVFSYFFIPPVGRAIDTAGESIFGKRGLINPGNTPQKIVESVPPPVKSLETGSFIVPAGSVLQVTNKQLTPQGNWLELKVCSIPEIVRSNSPKPESNKDFSTVSKPALNPSAAVATPSPSPVVKPTVGVEIAKLQAGEIGWIQEQAAVSKVVSNLVLNPTQQGKCVASDSNPNAN
jgi:hypothetical protein